jgi:hypothetical protein
VEARTICYKFEIPRFCYVDPRKILYFRKKWLGRLCKLKVNRTDRSVGLSRINALYKYVHFSLLHGLISFYITTIISRTLNMYQVGILKSNRLGWEKVITFI